MPAVNQAAGAARTRSAVCEALAGRVRAASEAAIAAFHAAAYDRRRIDTVECGQADRDTLGDIEEVADMLHGFASWALSGSPHPERGVVLSKLAGVGDDMGLNLKVRLSEHAPCEHLWRYVDALQDLRTGLLAYFEEEARSEHAGPATIA